MSNKIRIRGLGLEIEPGTSLEAKEVEKYRKERMGDVSILENAEGQQQKAAREAKFVKALGMKIKDLEEKSKEKGLELNDLVELEKRVKAMKDALALKESQVENWDQSNLMKAVRLYEPWQDGKVSVQELLKGIEVLGIAK